MTDAVIIERNGCKYLANADGDILYECGNLTNSRIIAMVRNGEYTNWRRYHLACEAPNTPGMGEKTYNKARWFNEGDFIFDILKKHPKRTYADCLLVASMEGFRIDECGILRRMAE